MFNPGNNYPAKLIDAGLQQTQKGNTQAYMVFEVTEGAHSQKLWWHGGFSEEVKPGKEKSQADVTFETLLAAGFAGDDVADLQKGILMFMPKDFTVKLGTDVKGGLCVQYVNTPKAKKAFTGTVPSLKGRLAMAKQKTGITNKKPDTDWP